MAGHRPFRELTKAMSPARKARVAGKAAVLETVMALPEVRKGRALSQEDVARKLDVLQPAVAKLERRGDMYVSNLRRYVEALGGKLEVTAHFPEGAVSIDLNGNERAGKHPGSLSPRAGSAAR